mgnify:CR=1 FL=1
MSDDDQSMKEILQLMWSDMKDLGRSLNAKIDSKIDALDAKLSARIDAVDMKLSGRIDILAARLDETNTRLSSDLAALDQRVDHLTLEMRAFRGAMQDNLRMLVRADKRQDQELDEIRARLDRAPS